MRRAALALLVALSAVSLPLEAAERSAAVRRAWVKANPCPGYTVLGKCTYDVEHRDPLCAGGADAPHNLYYLRRDLHRKKTKIDLAFCAVLRKTRINH